MKKNKERYMKIYELMLLNRKFEEALKELFYAGHVFGFLHLGIGQEAVGVGLALDLNDDDYLYHHHRGFAEPITKGMTPESIAAEFCGKTTGPAGGIGGFHAALPEKGLMGISGSLGEGAALACGSAYTCQLNKRGQVAVACMGDASADRETVAASWNFAKVWNLPVIFVIENNGVGIAVDIKVASATPHISDRAVGYNIPREIVDGNDVLAVNAAMNKAVERARKGGGPSVLEFMVRRWEPHAEGYPLFGFDVSEEDKAKGDCIARFLPKLQEVCTPEEIAAIDAKVAQRCEDIKKFAIESPLPAPETALDKLYIGR